jgi:hypothetical protein
MRQAWLFSLGCVLCLSLVLGCVSKAKARRDAQAAFIAGQHEATRRAQTAGQGPSVTINGPVNTPVLPWTEDLTLAKAIVQAESRLPASLRRSFCPFRWAFRLIQQLFRRDVPLQPGILFNSMQTRLGLHPRVALQMEAPPLLQQVDQTYVHSEAEALYFSGCDYYRFSTNLS